MSELLDDYEETQVRMEYLAYSSAYKRVIAELLYLGKHLGEKTRRRTVIHHKFTHQDIATLVATVFSQAKASSRIRTTHPTIVCLFPGLDFQAGIYKLDAVVTDADNLANRATVFLNSSDTNNGPILQPEEFLSSLSTTPTPLYVLTGSTHALGIRSVSLLPGAQGTVRRGSRSHQPDLPARGEYLWNGFPRVLGRQRRRSGYTTVTVKIREKPIVGIQFRETGRAALSPTTWSLAGPSLD